MALNKEQSAEQRTTERAVISSTENKYWLTIRGRKELLLYEREDIVVYSFHLILTIDAKIC